MNNMSPGAIFAAIIGILALAIGLSFLFAWPVMWLWNFAVVETIAGAAPLTFWKAWCLMILCHFLFKSNVSVNNKSS